MKNIILLTLFTAIIHTTTFASVSTWRINEDHSEIFFKVPYLSLSSVTGRFTKFTGRLNFNKDLVTPKNLTLKIKTKSLFSGNKIRDGHLMSNDFLMESKYEYITFKSTSLKRLKENTYEVHGQIQIKDTKKKIIFPIIITQTVNDSWGFENKFVSFKSTLNRQDFNINWNKSLKDSKYLVGDVIDVWGKFQVQPLNTQTPSYKFMIPNTKFTTLKDKLIRGDIEQEDFNKQLEGFRKNEITGKDKVAKVVIEKKIDAGTTPIVRPIEPKSTLWWTSYFIMGFIGFLATLIVCLQSKYYFMKIWPKKYNEVGILGIGSDIIAYLIAFIYVWAMWNLTYS